MNDTIARPTSKPMTRGAGSQLEFITNLLIQIGDMAPGRRDALRNEMNSQYRQRSFTTRDASVWIDRLRAIRNEIRTTVQAAEAQLRAQEAGIPAQRVAEPRPEVPSGRYAVAGEDGHTKFYRVANKDGHYTVYVFASTAQHRIQGWSAAKAILRKIEADGPQAAMIRFGLEMGSCGKCGTKLTDPESIAAGIGPICGGRRSK
jgi:hypothetical protein